jgi:hypothetical protein
MYGIMDAWTRLAGEADRAREIAVPQGENIKSIKNIT